MIQVRREPDSILIFSIHRLNYLLAEMEEIDLGLVSAVQKSNTFLHLILSHLYNLTQSDYYTQYLKTLELTFKIEDIINLLKICLKQLIHFFFVLELTPTERKEILSQTLIPVTDELKDLLLRFQQ